MQLVYEMFKRDFDMFKYCFEDLANKMPIGEIYLDEIREIERCLKAGLNNTLLFEHLCDRCGRARTDVSDHLSCCNTADLAAGLKIKPLGHPI